MMAVSLFVKALLSLIPLLSQTAAAPTVVDGKVSYAGILQDGVESFLNIKYGQDTGGANRFKQPLPFSYPAGTVINATGPGAACPQQTGNPTPALIGLFSNVTSISEDCLSIRVDRPPNTKADAKLPVMVFLYAGGFAIGQIWDAAYYPNGLVRETAPKGLPIIYVAMNYRVGVFGFASSSALRKEDNLNAGLLDQYLALQWVQDHIGAFGGDRDQVTIFGEDAGAASVAFQLTAYGGRIKPKFKRAILESGPTASGDQITSGRTDNHTAALTSILQCSSSTGDSAAELSCLRTLSLSTLVDAAVKYSFAFDATAGLGTFKPTAPSSFIPASPSKLFQSGQFVKGVNIMLGWAEDDGTQFVSPFIASDSAFTAWAAGQWPKLSAANFKELVSLYPESDFSDFTSEGIEKNYFRAARVQRDANFVCPSILTMDTVKWYSPASDIHLYAINLTLFRVGHALFNRSFVGSDHFSDIGYVFDYANVEPYSEVADQTDYDLASHMSGSWAAFAHFGQPTIPGVTPQQSLARNLTVAPWDEAYSPHGGDLALRILGGPRDGMATLPRTGFGQYGRSLYDEKLSIRCGFFNRPDVLEQIYM